MVDFSDTEHYRVYKRSEAIELLKLLEASQFDDDYEKFDYPNMTNEDLEAELCLSGVVHDTNMGGVIDD